MGSKLKSPEEWFTQAEYDFSVADALFKTGKYIYTVFICHLSIEKALKGLYTQILNETPTKTHSLIYLTKKAGILLPENLKEFITELNRVSIPTRYPEELKILLKEYDKQKAGNILKRTDEVLKWIKERLRRQ
ncbi:MAG: HEPN domain-containing protein [bacterium]